MEIKFDIFNLNCSVCALKAENAIKKLNGIKNVCVNLLEKTVFVEFDEKKINPKDMIKAVEDVGFKMSIHKKENIETNKIEYNKMKKRVIFSFIFAIPLFYVAMGEMLNFPMPKFLDDAILSVLIQLILLLFIVIINFKYFKNGFTSLFKMSANMDSLVALGTTSAIIYGLYSLYAGQNNFYFESAGTILTIVTFGKFLEFKAKEKTKNAIKKLINLSPKYATVLKNNEETTVKTDKIKKDDILIIKSGQIIPVDGIIIEGKCSIDESMLTGESIPILKEISDNVTAGTIVKSGFIKLKAINIGSDTTLSQIIQLVENINSTKAPIGRLADKVSSVFVPSVILLSLITFIVWIILKKDVDLALTFAISTLVISCPCALGLATPASIMVGSAKGFEYGILFKNAEILEKLHSIDTIMLDKTGTITKGKPSVYKIIPFKNISEDEILQISASIENLSEHPFAKAIVDSAKNKNLPLKKVNEYEYFEGKGIKGKIENDYYLIGNEKFLIENNVKLQDLSNYTDETPILFSKNNILEGIILISDTIKNSSIIAINKFKKMGLNVVMLTGDNKNTADKIAQKIGITNVFAGLLPKDKEIIIRKFQNENKKIIMVGDGINDALCLSRADIGIAIGSGSDIAIESADIVLIKNNLIDVINAIKLSKNVIINIKENLFWALFYNSIAIPVAMGCFNFIGLRLNPMIAAFAMGLSSIFVIGNALRLNNLKLEKTINE